MATKRQRRERLARAEQDRREQEQQVRRRRAIRTAGIVAAAVVAIAVAAFAYVQLTEDKPVVTPDGVTAAGGVRYPADSTEQRGNETGSEPVEVVVYEDPLCEHCRDFEEEHGEYLQEAAERGAIDLEYRPIAFLGDDSIAPINAAACVLDAAGPKAFVTFHDALFAGEYADDSVDGLAADAGAGGSGVADCIDAGTHDGWVDKVTSAATDDGVEGTPTVRIDGEAVPFEDLDDVETMVEEAKP